MSVDPGGTPKPLAFMAAFNFATPSSNEMPSRRLLITYVLYSLNMVEAWTLDSEAMIARSWAASRKLEVCAESLWCSNGAPCMDGYTCTHELELEAPAQRSANCPISGREIRSNLVNRKIRNASILPSQSLILGACVCVAVCVAVCVTATHTATHTVLATLPVYTLCVYEDSVRTRRNPEESVQGQILKHWRPHWTPQVPPRRQRSNSSAERRRSVQSSKATAQYSRAGPVLQGACALGRGSGLVPCAAGYALC